MKDSEKNEVQQSNLDLFQNLNLKITSCENLPSPSIQQNNSQTAHKIFNHIQSREKNQFFKEFFQQFLLKNYNNSKHLWQLNTKINIYYDKKESSSLIYQSQVVQKNPLDIFSETEQKIPKFSNLESFQKVILPKQVNKIVFEQQPEQVQYSTNKKSILNRLEIKFSQVMGKLQKKKQDNKYLTKQIQQYWQKQKKNGFPLFKTQKILSKDNQKFILEQVYFKQLINTLLILLPTISFF